MLGVEAVDNILFGTCEITLHHPNIVNAAKNTDLKYQQASTVAIATKQQAHATEPVVVVAVADDEH